MPKGKEGSVFICLEKETANFEEILSENILLLPVEATPEENSTLAGYFLGKLLFQCLSLRWLSFLGMLSIHSTQLVEEIGDTQQHLCCAWRKRFNATRLAPE